MFATVIRKIGGDFPDTHLKLISINLLTCMNNRYVVVKFNLNGSSKDFMKKGTIFIL